MTHYLNELVNQLRVERIEDTIYRGQSKDNFGTQRIFGGQVLGQALMAAHLTVEPNRHPHSLHAYFLRPGDTNHPVVYEVDKIRDGGSFSSRRVVAIQHGQAIFHLGASFHGEEKGFEHQCAMPDVAGPEGLANESQLIELILQQMPHLKRERLNYEKAIEIRPVNPKALLIPGNNSAQASFWVKANGTLDQDPLIHDSMLAYVSDYYLLFTALLPHAKTPFSPNMQFATIDHAMWFHRPVNLNDWLLYHIESPSASNGRGYCQGRIFNRSGELVASTVQEGLIREVSPTA